MNELWQLFDGDGNVLEGKGATKDEVFSKGLLHGASHVWIWRNNDGVLEVLLQKRAANKRTWPNRFDISVAGHIDLAEDPLTAALRETREEIGLEINGGSLQEISREKAYMTAENGAIENEFQWLYLLKAPENSEFLLQEEEVDSLAWKELAEFEADCSTDLYVPHGQAYYSKVIAAIKSAQIDS
jgi:isopentenyldiphosphate isomerase